MNWLHFSLWLTGFYLLYYAIIILLDIAGGKRSPASIGLGNELTFSENVAPAKLGVTSSNTDKPVALTSLNNRIPDKRNEPEMIGSGGVVIDGLFKLCKLEALQYTRSVGF